MYIAMFVFLLRHGNKKKIKTDLPYIFMSVRIYYNFGKKTTN